MYLTGFGVAAPVKVGATATIRSLKILQGATTAGDVIYNQEEETKIQRSENELVKKITLT